MSGAKLILFSGLPGSGKTTLARMLAEKFYYPLFAKDRIQATLRLHNLAGRATVDGYHLILALADEQLSMGMSVILDAVFPLRGFRAEAASLAQKNNASFVPIFCYCSDDAVWQARMENRQRYVPHWTPVGWSDVERLRPTFHRWDPRSTLYVNSLNSAAHNFGTVVDWLKLIDFTEHSPSI